MVTLFGNYKGKWILTENKVSSVYTYSSIERIPVGTEDEDIIKSIQSDTLTYLTQYGNTKRYKRISN